MSNYEPTSKYDGNRNNNPAGFDDVFIERTEENGLCDICGRACRLYMKWNRGYLREEDVPKLVCKGCTRK